MKIAFILPNYCLIDGKAGGVRVQASQWAEYMRSAGYDVVEIGIWGDYDWKSFDIIQYFYFGFSFQALYESIRNKAPQAKFVCAPILDPHEPIWVYKILSWLKIPKIKLWNEFSLLRSYRDFFDLFFARTFFERKYLIEAFGIDEKKIKVVPLNSRLTPVETPAVKQNFCLHVSRICDPTKSVKRLVEAALKYDFDLVLAGSSTDEFDSFLRRIIGNRKNVTLLGRVSDEQLSDLYGKARVFALPSTREGVGLVALEAASYGCDIVITNIGGPQEYFLPNAIAVDPYDVDAIGTAVKSFLDGKTFQPALRECIAEKYSAKVIIKQLDGFYKGVL
jgi:glycosyltransferase involved in cell wall biosynthesis